MKIGFFGAGKMAEGILSAIEDYENRILWCRQDGGGDSFRD